MEVSAKSRGPSKRGSASCGSETEPFNDEKVAKTEECQSDAKEYKSGKL